jgi:phage-related protein
MYSSVRCNISGGTLTLKAMISLPLSTCMAFLLALWCLSVASADDKYPVAVGGGTPLQEILDGIWKIPFIAGIIIQITAIINTIYTFIVNIVLTPPVFVLEKGEN